MDAQFEKLRQEVEIELGRPLEQPEEIELKGLFYFAKGVEMKNQLEQRRRVISAVRDFMSRRKKRSRKHVTNKETGLPTEQRMLLMAERHDGWRF